jgi:hypothetical protein
MIITHPTDLNWFYEAVAIRIERELSTLGHRVRRIPATELSPVETGETRILIVNLLESQASAKALGRAEDFMEAVGLCPERILLNYDSVRSHWFLNQIRYEPDLITHVIDLGIASQEADYQGELPYHWLPETLDHPADDYASVRSGGARPLPWCVVGHAAKPRARLVHDLMRVCDPGGFAYVPPLQPFGGQAGLDQEGLHRVLSASDLLVWNSYHDYPYHEGLRALHAVAAGAAPAKIDPKFHHRFADIPWVYPSVEAMARQRQILGVDAMWRQALGFFRDRPALGTSLAAILDRL